MTTERAGRSRRGKLPARKFPTPAAAAIGELVHRLGIGKTLSQYDVMTSWESIVGEQIARVAKAQRIENGVLFVGVTTAPWRAELSMKRIEIIDKINRALGKNIVKEIRFR